VVQNETFMFLKPFVCKLYEIEVIKEHCANTLDCCGMYTSVVYFKFLEFDSRLYELCSLLECDSRLYELCS